MTATSCCDYSRERCRFTCRISNTPCKNPPRGIPALPITPRQRNGPSGRCSARLGPISSEGTGLLERGVVIRHLILPGALENTFRVIDWVQETFRPGDVLFSLMSQYTPCGDLSAFPELNRRLMAEEYDAAMFYLEDSDIEDGFFQELSAAKEEYIPEFDLSGV